MVYVVVCLGLTKSSTMKRVFWSFYLLLISKPCIPLSPLSAPRKTFTILLKLFILLFSPLLSSPPLLLPAVSIISPSLFSFSSRHLKNWPRPLFASASSSQTYRLHSTTLWPPLASWAVLISTSPWGPQPSSPPSCKLPWIWQTILNKKLILARVLRAQPSENQFKTLFSHCSSRLLCLCLGSSAILPSAQNSISCRLSKPLAQGPGFSFPDCPPSNSLQSPVWILWLSAQSS